MLGSRWIPSSAFAIPWCIILVLALAFWELIGWGVASVRLRRCGLKGVSPPFSKNAKVGHDLLSAFGVVFSGSGGLHRIAPDFMALQSA